MTHALNVCEAEKNFGQTRALDGAAFHLNKGEILALLGPNGAGKTTLVKAVAGRVILDSGTLELLGTPIHRPSAAANEVRSQLGIVPQETALYGRLTATENMRSFADFHGVNRSVLPDRIAWALEWTGLADRASDLVDHYSGGMKRRLNIACSVLHKPQVLILDEPTVGVDPQSRERIWQMVSQLRDEGTSLVLTTHLLDEAEEISDRITIIDHGKTIATGTLDELTQSSIGTARRVKIVLAEPIDTSSFDLTLTSNGSSLLGQMNNVGSELNRLIEQLEAAGARVTDLRVSAPSLQDVFIHLTGRELRD